MVLYEKREKIHVIDYYIIPEFPTVKEVLHSLDIIKAISNHDSQVFGAVMKAESAIKEFIFEGTCQRQSKLTDYLNKIN